MNRKLALLKRVGEVEDVVIDDLSFEIGRCKTAKVIIPNINVSRNHCRLTFKDFMWSLEDFSSSGTYINGELIGRGKHTKLKNFDTIQIGPKECNFIWEFRTDAEEEFSLMKVNNSMAEHSQKIVDIHTKKEILERKIILIRESFFKMKLEKEKIHKQCLDQIAALEKKFLSEKVKLENQVEESQNEIEKQSEEEKRRLYNETEKKLFVLQENMTENNKLEEQLKLEIQILQAKLIEEKCQWEKRFIEEKMKLEEKLNEQKEKLVVERLKVEELALIHEQELEDKLKKEEEEKKVLMAKLREMEEAKDNLSRKLKESDELHLLDKARLEEMMKRELLEQEENVKAQLQEQIDSLKKAQFDIENKLRAEFEEHENMKSQNLLKELDRVKSILSQSESRQRMLENELAVASSLKDEASKVKSHILENFAELMETELQCSICSELFVNAITLNCTHTFCKYCIDRWKKKKKSCPFCRKKITSENRSIFMDNYIDKMVENLSDEFKSRRKMIIEERNSEATEKKLEPPPSFAESADLNETSSSAVRRHRRVTEGRTLRNRLQSAILPGNSR